MERPARPLFQLSSKSEERRPMEEAFNMFVPTKHTARLQELYGKINYVKEQAVKLESVMADMREDVRLQQNSEET